MSTSKDKNIYDPGAAKDYAATGWGGANDMSKYGIDYSPEQREAIAQIFRDSATAAYGTAQNEFSNTMAQQQASLSDTIRRSQAQAVATGASKGMQAANELSSMLGLQQTAAEQASAMQGSYAQALADAQTKAYEVQNAANQVGMQGYAADSASEAQKYAANVDAYTNDPYRIINEVFALKDSDNPQYQATGDALLQAFLQNMGMDPDSAKNAVAGVGAGYTEGGLKAPSSWGTTDTKGLNNTDKGNNFRIFVGNNKYYVELGSEIKTTDITSSANKAGVKNGQAFVIDTPGYEGIYYKSNGRIYSIGGRSMKAELKKEGSQYNNLANALRSSGNILSM